MEAIIEALGGTAEPLIEAIKAGQIRGAAGVVGCNNPKITQDYGHTTITRELIAHDILVLDTGCTAVANAKAGFKRPEAAELAGPGLRAVCRALNMPPVLHMGSCVDNTRIINLAAPWPTPWGWTRTCCRWRRRPRNGIRRRPRL